MSRIGILVIVFSLFLLGVYGWVEHVGADTLVLSDAEGPVLSNDEVTVTNSVIRCQDGMAGIYPCKNVDLLAHLPLEAIGGGGEVTGSDHWGWTDPESGRDYVLFGLSDGTAFIDISVRENPIYLGKLPGHDGASQWRDIKVYQNAAYITADIPTASGLQVFDLTLLRDVENPPVEFSATNHYDEFGPGHNLWVNADSGFLYVFRSDTCNSEIHMIDVGDPLNPTFADCFEDDDAPLSDSECVIYQGPDSDFVGHEICFTGSDDNMSIGDVTDKEDAHIINTFEYPGIVRAHQGSLTADHRYWLMSDTMDEATNGHNTRTYVFDAADLTEVRFLGFYEHATTARDHNLYIIGTTMYQTNWQAGLRVLDISSLPMTNFVETGFFDIVPDSDSVAMEGAWSNYPWWDDGVVTVSGTQGGLFVLRPYPKQSFLPIISQLVE